MKKNKPLYTKARHEVYNPDYMPKALQLHHKCEWQNKHHGNEKCFFTVYAAVQKYIPGSETNGRMPLMFFNLKLGNYNNFKVNMRDFMAFNEAIQELAQWCDANKETLQEAMENELLAYQDHQLRIFLSVTQNNTLNEGDVL